MDARFHYVPPGWEQPGGQPRSNEIDRGFFSASDLEIAPAKRVLRAVAVKFNLFKTRDAFAAFRKSRLTRLVPIAGIGTYRHSHAHDLISRIDVNHLSSNCRRAIAGKECSG